MNGPESRRRNYRMNEDNKLKRQIEKAVVTFVLDYLGVTPKSVGIDILSI